MIHKMKLKESPFERIKDGTKTIEFRLYDEKRKQIKIGDKIEFSKLPELQEKILVEVLDLYKEETFEKLFKKIYTDEEEINRKTKSMYQYYTPEKEKEYGVIGIKISLIKDKKENLYIARHGQTDWNVEQKVQGKADIVLNEKGYEQAEEVAKKLLNENIELIICSPLKRAMETANIINKNRNIDIIYDDRISERDFGEFEGRKKETFDYQGLWSYKNNNKYDKVENIQDFFKRIYNFLDDIKVKFKGKNILLVTHGGVSIPVNCYFNGIPEYDNLLNLALKNCEYSEYKFEIE